jgi:dolichol-phosphate mannosyltransferase
LDELVRGVENACKSVSPLTYEIVLINDGSRDRSWAKIAEFADHKSHIVGVNLARNYGHQLALSAGLQICRGNLVLVMDADLQDPPELLPDMLAKMAEGHDVVYGQRISRAGETLFKRASASLFYRFLQKLVDVPMPRDTGDFRIMSRRVVDHLNAMPERFRFIRGMVSWIGFRQAALPYERDPRFAGHSHYPLSKMIGFAVDAVTSFSTLPLRLAAHIGLVVGVMGVCTLGWVGVSYMTGHVLAGWTSLVGTVLLLGSVQLMMLGVFGEYLGRMYMESKQRPLFIIQDIRATQERHDTANPVHRLNRQLRQVING